jgi:hypothetical protein
LKIAAITHAVYLVVGIAAIVTTLTLTGSERAPGIVATVWLLVFTLCMFLNRRRFRFRD